MFSYYRAYIETESRVGAKITVRVCRACAGYVARTVLATKTWDISNAHKAGVDEAPKREFLSASDAVTAANARSGPVLGLAALIGSLRVPLSRCGASSSVLREIYSSCMPELHLLTATKDGYW